jgi:hypothetical protein
LRDDEDGIRVFILGQGQEKARIPEATKKSLTRERDGL